MTRDAWYVAGDFTDNSPRTTNAERPVLMNRFVITVDFYLLPGALDPFLALIKENARRSLAEEAGCHRFDVLVQKGVPDHIVLYEIYQNRAAFDIHLKSRHFAEFNSASAPYVSDKKVIEYEYVNDDGD